jgi:Tripartite tricarboxylate transporter TctB family
MNDRNLVRGLFLTVIALAFGLQALRYPIGNFGRPGPGMFPLMVSSLLLVIGLSTVLRSRFVEREGVEFNKKNIAIILASLCGFALISEHLNMIAGITFMVFCASFAGTATYSVVRNLKISAGLIAVALAFLKLLGFNLPLY